MFSLPSYVCTVSPPGGPQGKKEHAWNLKFSPKYTHYMWHALVSFLNRMITLIHNFRMPGGSNIWQHYFGKSRWKCRVDITKTSSITPDIKYTEYTEFYSVLQNTQSLVCYLYLLNQRGIWETNKPKKKASIKHKSCQNNFYNTNIQLLYIEI